MSGGEETFICEKCNKRLPTISKIIHEVRCNGSIIKEEEKNVPITEARKTYITTTSGTDISNIIVPAQEIKNIKSSSSSSSSKIVESNLKSTSIIEESNDYIACKVCTYHNSLENIPCECCGSNLISGSLNGSMNSSTNSLDNHADNNDNDNDNDEYWSCSVCTYNNSIDIDKCLMCNTAVPSNLRRPDEIIRDRLINDNDDDDDDGVCNYSSYESIGESNRIHPLAAAGLGSMAGMMLARMQNRPMSSGMVEGAAFGAMSSMLLNEFMSRSNIEDRQSRIDDNFFNNGHDPFSNFREHDNLFQAFRELIESSDNSSESPPSSETLQSINSLPTHKYNGENSMSCNICLEPFCNGEDVKTLPCLHLYHSNCIDNWLVRQTNCPVCKTSL